MSQQCYRFAGVEIRPVERQLLIDGAVAPLQARAFDLLLALIERRDRVVTRSELYDVVWAGRIVEDNNLAVQVHALRKLLGERAVLTVPGRGYRFALTPPDEPREPAGAATPVASPSAWPPLPASRLLGRDDELLALDALLAQHRLVSVVGAGGIGKTVLALAVARARRDARAGEVVWIELAQIFDPALLASAIAPAFGLTVGAGADPLRSLVRGLVTVEALLLLDNAEHLVETVARFAAALLAGAPRMRLLVTSQAALRIDGERVFRLGALAIPEKDTPLVEAASHGAVALFAEAATAADRRFVLGEANVATVIDLCRHLDGLPLAIKLAAARLPLLGLHGLEARIAERLKVIGGGNRDAPTRQQTLLAALDWSHSLLSRGEQAVFRRLGVFVGGFTLAFAVDVAKDDERDDASVIEMLSNLVDRSLVVAGDDDPPRYRLLESAREYALLRLDEAGETALRRQRHARVVAAWMARESVAFLIMPDDEWLPRAEPELDNVRAALDWTARHDAAAAVALVGSAQRLFFAVDSTAELQRRAAALEALLSPEMPPLDVAKYWAARAHGQAGRDYGAMHDYAAKAVDLFRRTRDANGLYYALGLLLWSGRVPIDRSTDLINEAAALERAAMPAKLVSIGRFGLSNCHYFEGRYADALRESGVALSHARAGGLRRTAAAASGVCAMAHYALGQTDEAVELCRQAAVEQAGQRYGVLAFPLGFLAVGFVLQGNLAEARATLGELFRLCRAADWWLFNVFNEAYFLLAAREGRDESAAKLFGYIDRKARSAIGLEMAAGRTRPVRVALEAKFEATRWQALLAEGERLDEEAVCAITLEAASASERSASLG